MDDRNRIRESIEEAAVHRLNLNLLYPLDAILHAPTLTEAGRRVLQFAFEELKAERLQASWFYDNPKSGRVLEKLGFKPDGEGEIASLSRGVTVNCHVVALDRATYMTRKMMS